MKGKFYITTICKNCNKEYLHPKYTKLYYCSVSCSRQHMKGVNHPSWNGGMKKTPCTNCGIEIEKKKSRITSYNFCSTKCFIVYHPKIREANKNKKKIKKSCIVCSADIFVRKSREFTEGKYCSKKCTAIGYKDRFTGENNPNYVHGDCVGKVASGLARRRKMRDAKLIGRHSKSEWELLKLQYGNSCPKCKKKEPKIWLTKDHIVPISKGGSDGIDNIQPLCLDCNLRKMVQSKKYSHQESIVFDLDFELMLNLKKKQLTP